MRLFFSKPNHFVYCILQLFRLFITTDSQSSATLAKTFLVAAAIRVAKKSGRFLVHQFCTCLQKQPSFFRAQIFFWREKERLFGRLITSRRCRPNRHRRVRRRCC